MPALRLLRVIVLFMCACDGGAVCVYYGVGACCVIVVSYVVAVCVTVVAADVVGGCVIVHACC